MPGGQYSGAQPADGVADSVCCTNWSILPPSTAFSSAVYPWFWSEVRASGWVSRWGLYSLGLLVSSGPAGPDLVSLVYSPLTVGVPGLAVNLVPSVLAAYG